MTPSLLTRHDDASHLPPILIVDKQGILGESFARSIGSLNTYKVAFVTAAPLQALVPYIHIPFKGKIPRIPDDTFSQIFLFFEGEKELLSLLPQFVRKAEADKAPLTLVTSIYFLTKEKLSLIRKHAPEAILFLYGDIGGGDASSQLNSLFLEALTFGSVKINNNGLSYLYPTPLPYLLGGLFEVIYGTLQKGKTYAIFEKHPVTMLSFARELKKLYPEIRLDFLPGKGESLPHLIPPDVQHLSFPSLHEWLRTLSLPKVPPVTLPGKKKRVRLPRKVRRVPWRWVFLFVFFVLIVPFSISVSSALAGGLLLKSGVRELSQASFLQSERDFQYAKNLFAFSDMVSLPYTLLEAMNVSTPATILRNTIGAGDDISSAGLLFVQAGRTYEQITSGKSTDPNKDIQLVTERLKRGITLFQRLEAEDALPALIASQLNTYKSSLHLLSAVVDALPTLTGFPTKQTYLVVFQNNKELRAGGGFIGSYGLLTFSQGKMESLTLHDVYDADGQLKGHVEPPFALKRYLGAAHWYLRDSNYSIDFPRNAERAEFFLEKETGQKVAGVMSIDATALEDLLSLTGPIKLPDYNQLLTSDNAFSLLETKTQEKFFPGSSQKKNILGATYTALRERLFSDKHMSGKLLQLLSQEIAQKHVLFTSNDEALAKVLATNDLSSAVPQESGDPSLIEDIMGENEMNLGQNKVNAYITRKLDHSVKIDEKGVLMAGTSVTLKNASTPESVYGGDYDVYLRFITPLQSEFLSLAIDDVDQTTVPAETNPSVYTSKLFKPKGVELEKTEEEGRTLYGVHVVVPMGNQKKVTLTYALPGEKSDATFTYQLALFKQPGTLADPLSVSLTFPNTFLLLNTSPQVVKAETSANYDGFFTQDGTFFVTLSRKK